MAEVTRRHREQAFAAIGGDPGQVHEYAIEFLNRGYDPSSIYPITARIAQAIADAEERGTPGARYRAWEEGHAAGEVDGVSYEMSSPLHTETQNPYPAPEKADTCTECHQPDEWHKMDCSRRVKR